MLQMQLAAFIKVCRYIEIFYKESHIAAFFETSVLKEVCIFRYLHNNSTVLTPKFRNNIKIWYTILD